MTRTSPILFATLIVGCMLTAPHAWGQDQDEDGPALGVARVSLINGDVTVRRGDSGDWIEAEVNLPLVEGDSIATGRASRAEVQLDYSNLLRLHEESRVNLAELANRRFRVQLEQGVVTYSEHGGGEADIDIETALVAVRPRKRGQYRVEVFGDQRVIVTVREGEAEIASADGIETLKEGRSMIVRAGEAGTEFQNAKAEPKDDWDRWNERRDDQLRKSESRRYVSDSVYGAEDLDDHGHWTYVSGYGRTWFPSVAVGWAPYRHGRWVWLDYYGWSWVGYEPWGWAPYHYGRWFHHAGHGWGWYPGPRYSRHYWRPALVSFFGYGRRGGFGFGIGFGNVGWVPLAPGERYHPWYGRRFRDGFGRGGGRHNTTIFVDNSVNIVNNYRNARHRNGVTVVDGNRFGQRGNGGRAATARDFEGASIMRGQLPIVPGREHQGRIVRAGNGAPGDDRRDGARGTTFFNSGRSTRSVQRTSFERQQEQIRASVRSFGESSQGGNGNPAAGVVAAEGARSGRARSNERGSTGTAPEQGPARAGIRSGPEIRGGSGEATPGADSSQTPAARSPQRSRSSRTGQDARSSGGNTESSGGIRSGGQGFPSASPPRSRSGGDTSMSTPSTGGGGGGGASSSEGGARTRSRFNGGSASSGSWQGFGNGGARATRSSESPARVDSSSAQAEPERRSSSRGFARSEPRSDTSGQAGISSSSGVSSRSRPSREQSPSATEPRSTRGSREFAPRSASRVDDSSRSSRSRSNVTPDSGSSGVREQDRGRSMQTRPSREPSPGAMSRPSASRSQSGISSSPSRGDSGRSSVSRGGMSGGGISRGSVSGGSAARSSGSRGSASRGSMSSGGGGGGGRGGGGGGSVSSGGGGGRGGRGGGGGGSVSSGGGSGSRGGGGGSVSSGGGSRGGRGR